MIKSYIWKQETFIKCEVCGETAYVWKDKVFPVCAVHAYERLKIFLMDDKDEDDSMSKTCSLGYNMYE